MPVIQPTRNTPGHESLNPALMFRRLFAHRDLIRRLVVRNIHLRHRGSYLGFTWSFLNPLLLLGLYTFVFGIIFGGGFGVVAGETTLDYALGVFIGLSIHHLVSETMANSTYLILSNTNLVKKVVFPLEILPVTVAGGALYHFCISFLLAVAGILFLGDGLTWHALWLPVILFPAFFLTLGIAWFTAALGVFFRDLAQLIQFLSLALLFGSAVFYSPAMVPDPVWTVLRFNPIIHTIHLSREAALWGMPIDVLPLLYTYGFGIISCLLGYFFFMKAKPAFADVL